MQTAAVATIRQPFRSQGLLLRLPNGQKCNGLRMVGAVDEHVHARCACLAGTAQTSRLLRRGRRRWAQPAVLVQYTHQLSEGSLLERVIFSLYQGEVPHFRPRPQNIKCARHRLPPTGKGYQPASVPHSSPVGAVWGPQGAPRRPGLGLSSLGTRGRVAGD